MKSITEPTPVIRGETIEEAAKDVETYVTSALAAGMRGFVKVSQTLQPEAIRAIESQLASTREKQHSAEAQVITLRDQLTRTTKDAEVAASTVSNIQKQLALHERVVQANSAHEQRLVDLDKQCKALLAERVEREVQSATYKQQLQHVEREVIARTATLTTNESRCQELQLSKHQSDILVATLREKISLLENRSQASTVDQKEMAQHKTNEADHQRRVSDIQREADRLVHNEQLRHDSKLKELEIQFRQSQQTLETALQDERNKHQATIALRTIDNQRMASQLQDEKTKATTAITERENDRSRLLSELANRKISDEEKWVAIKTSLETVIGALKSELDVLKKSGIATEQKAKADLEASKRDSTLALEMLRMESKEQCRLSNVSLVDKLTLLGQELESKKAVIQLMEKQADEWKKNGLRMLPSDLGNAGEAEIEQLLQRTIGNWMTVRNVSKGGHGHELDLELVSRDGSVRIRIDVKNALRVPEDQITRFHSDIDGLKPPPTAAILFMKVGLRGDTAKSGQPPCPIMKSRRGTTMVVQIGWWATDLLIETIHDIVVASKIELLTTAQAMRPFAGSTEVCKAVIALTDLVAFQNEQADKAGIAIKDWKTLGAQKNRVVADELRTAHAANANAIPKEVLVTFEKLIPKRNRGRPPAVAPAAGAPCKPKSKKRKLFNETDSDSDTPTKKPSSKK